MNRSHIHGLAGLVLVLSALSCVAPAQQAAPGADSATSEEQFAMEFTLPAELDDPAFGRYVDIRLLEEAWTNKDADQLIDIALQLAEGERVLMRKHKAGSAKDLLKLAAMIASRKGDKAAIARIEKGAKALKLDDIAGTVSMLAGESRAAEPALTVSLDRFNLDDVAAYGLLLDRVHGAEILRDTLMLDQIEQSLGQFEALSDNQKSYVQKIIGEARSAIDEAKEGASENSIVETIGKLEGGSRQMGGGYYYRREAPLWYQDPGPWWTGYQGQWRYREQYSLQYNVPRHRAGRR